jgi:hypothetical protein
MGRENGRKDLKIRKKKDASENISQHWSLLVLSLESANISTCF